MSIEGRVSVFFVRSFRMPVTGQLGLAVTRGHFFGPKRERVGEDYGIR